MIRPWVRFERTASFKADYRRLSEAERDLFRGAVRDFNRACDQHIGEPGARAWPAGLRVKAVAGATGVWEMTWSFSGPDGRATWEWTTVEVVDDQGKASREPAVRWRRSGGHEVFRDP